MNIWPCVELLAYLDDPSDSDVITVMRLIDALERRRWYPRVPELVNQRDAVAGTQPDDAPLCTLGAVLHVLAPRGARGQALGRAEDERQFYQAESFLLAISEFSSTCERTFIICYGGSDIGEIVAGHVGKSVSKGLLDPWRLAVGLSGVNKAREGDHLQNSGGDACP